MIVRTRMTPFPKSYKYRKAFIVTLTLSENIQRESEESDSLKNTKNYLKNSRTVFRLVLDRVRFCNQTTKQFVTENSKREKESSAKYCRT